MISPRARYEKEQFWELAEDIASLDMGSKYGQDTGTESFSGGKRKKTDLITKQKSFDGERVSLTGVIDPFKGISGR